MAVDEETTALIAQYLGREPRGLQAVVASYNGEPCVIRVASLVDDKPFPTLFWLVNPTVNYQIDRLEARGLIAELQAEIDANEELQASMRADHLAYIELRARYMEPATVLRIAELGFEKAFTEKGIGGIGDFSRIRCLHTWYGAHLVVPNAVGRLLQPHLDELREQLE